ncbi:hypothetical protein [Burkholderia gladioli]|uniref:hypothetical protein n=1 Tax=Burkholderia gladioli TaxID=28095 RepID=UPI0016416BCC|nr:hypothetical protein [Burkholderia gladioli]
MTTSNDIEVVIRRVEETLQTARQGLDDLLDVTRSRRMSGLRNLIVFGRSVTFVLQNLRSVVGDDVFNAWYEPHQERMRGSYLMRYFVDARNELEKQGRLNVTTSTRIDKFSLNTDMGKFGPPPLYGTDFFIGDQLGGTGWIVKLPGGKTEKYYVDLPESIGEVKQVFTNIPESKAPELIGRSIEDLSSTYINELDRIVREAREHFLPSSTTTTQNWKGTHLRIVK